MFEDIQLHYNHFMIDMSNIIYEYFNIEHNMQHLVVDQITLFHMLQSVPSYYSISIMRQHRKKSYLQQICIGLGVSTLLTKIVIYWAATL